MLPPSDRANLYGPYYAHHWNVSLTASRTDSPPSRLVALRNYTGRANGIVYWGDFNKKVKLSIGAFDGATLTGNAKVLGAARLQFDFWDPENGYYLNGTYYGDGNILAIGGSTQVQSGKTNSNIDFLMEKKLASGGVISLESQYTNYNGLGGYVPGYKSQGAYALASYLFPQKVGVGQFEVLGKYGSAQFHQGPGAQLPMVRPRNSTAPTSSTVQCRIVGFWVNTNFTNSPDTWKGGLGLQIRCNRHLTNF
jgi:hypothetical protein